MISRKMTPRTYDGPKYPEFFYVKKQFVSSAILNAGVDVTDYVRGDPEGLAIDHLWIDSDAVGLAHATLDPALQLKITPVTGQFTGTPQGLLIFWTINAAKTALGAAKTVPFDAGTVKVLRGLPRGCKLQLLASTGTGFEGAGLITIYIRFRRVGKKSFVKAAP